MFALMLASSQISVGQNNITMNSPPLPGIYEASGSITLLPGFSFTASQGNSLTLRINSGNLDLATFETYYSGTQYGYTKFYNGDYYLIDNTQSNL